MSQGARGSVAWGGNAERQCMASAFTFCTHGFFIPDSSYSGVLCVTPGSRRSSSPASQPDSSPASPAASLVKLSIFKLSIFNTRLAKHLETHRVLMFFVEPMGKQST